MADLPCPTCGSPLTFLDQYQRYYCHRCFQYAPEGYGDRGAQKCPTCGGILSYVRQYGRMYCYRCSSYPPEESKPESRIDVVTPPSTPSATEPTGTTTPSASGGGVTELVSAPKPVEPTPVTPTLISPEISSPSPIAEPTPKTEEAKPEAPPAVVPVVSEGTPSEPALTAPTSEAPKEPVPAPPSMDMRILSASKPAAIRVKLFVLKKPDLVDLCRIYNLDPSGAKDDLQQRLLAYLHDVDSAGEAPPPGREPSEAPAAGTTTSAPPTHEGPPTPSATEAAPAPAASQIAVTPEVEAPSAASVATPIAEPTPVVVAPGPAVTEAPHAATRAEHPCPTCGRELTYISQYNRWYCYYCQRYAPAAARAKNACPTCGATMRWIGQHRRWWCDSCQKYASADLPPPAGAMPAAALAEPATSGTVPKAIVIHHHGSPAGGAGLVGVGLALYIVYAFFAFLGDMMGFAIPSGITPQLLGILQLLAFLLVAAGAIVGLYGIRDRV